MCSSDLLTIPPIKKLALKYNLPVFQPEKIKSDYQEVLNWRPDIIITCAYGQIIPKVLLDYPNYQAINVHASLLPKYRGGAPIHRAIMDGCQFTGITIMYMDEKLDEGDIISQEKVPIDYQDNVETLHDKLSLTGAKLLINTLPSIFNKTNKKIKQNHNEGTYAYNIKPEDELIDWSKEGYQIYNHIRGLSPWPGAYTLLNNKRIKIYRSEIVKEIKKGTFGEITRIEKEGIIVKTGNDMGIKLLDIKLEGRKLQEVKEVLNGKHPFIVGQKFSS